jgi:hypothetical protein
LAPLRRLIERLDKYVYDFALIVNGALSPRRGGNCRRAM